MCPAEEMVSEAAANVVVDEYSLTVEERNKRDLFQQYSLEISIFDIEERLNEANTKGRLPDVRFHVLGLNVWTDEEMFPAELALVEFSLAHGITATFSKKLRPTRMPVGFLSDAKLISDQTHGMFLSDADLSVDYSDIVTSMAEMLAIRAGERPPKVNLGAFAHGKYYEILDLIDEETDRRQKINLLPIFVMPNEEAKIATALKWLMEQAKCDTEFALYPLDELFFRLMSKGSSSKAEALSMARQRLCADTLVYNADLSCRFHSDLDRGHFCAQTSALRRALVVIDFGAKNLEIGLIDGKHVPNETADFVMQDDEYEADSNMAGRGVSRRRRQRVICRHSLQHFLLEPGAIRTAQSYASRAESELSFSVGESAFDD